MVTDQDNNSRFCIYFKPNLSLKLDLVLIIVFPNILIIYCFNIKFD